MLALISTKPLDIVQLFPSGPTRINVPGKLQAYDVDAGWASADGAYKMVAVKPAVIPSGKVSIGSDYSIDENGDVIETCQFEDAPAPPTPAKAPLSAREFRLLFTDAERLAVTQAGMQSAQIRVFLDDAGAAEFVEMDHPEVIAGINALKGIGLLTDERATQILSGVAPQPEGIPDVVENGQEPG